MCHRFAKLPYGPHAQSSHLLPSLWLSFPSFTLSSFFTSPVVLAISPSPSQSFTQTQCSLWCCCVCVQRRWNVNALIGEDRQQASSQGAHHDSILLTRVVGSPGDSVLPKQQGHVKLTVNFGSTVSENLLAFTATYICAVDAADEPVVILWFKLRLEVNLCVF